MVGGLIQQHQLGGAHQGPRQVETNAPAAGKVSDRAFNFIRLETQAIEQRGRSRPCRVAVNVFHFFMQCRETFKRLVLLSAAQGFEGFTEGVITGHDVLNRRLLAGTHLLCHVSDAIVPGQLDLAGISF